MKMQSLNFNLLLFSPVNSWTLISFMIFFVNINITLYNIFEDNMVPERIFFGVVKCNDANDDKSSLNPHHF